MVRAPNPASKSTDVLVYSISVCPTHDALGYTSHLGLPPTISALPPHLADIAARYTLAVYGVRAHYAILGNSDYLSRWQAYVDATRNGLVRFQIPFIGPLAERWVYEE